MSKEDKNLIHKLSKTELLDNKTTKEIFNKLLLRSYHNTTDDEEIKVIGAIALKYGLSCCDDIINNIEFNGFPLPF